MMYIAFVLFIRLIVTSADLSPRTLWSNIGSVWKNDNNPNHPVVTLDRILTTHNVLPNQDCKTLIQTAKKEIKKIKTRRRICFDDHVNPSLFYNTTKYKNLVDDRSTSTNHNCIHKQHSKKILKQLPPISHAVTYSPTHHPRDTTHPPPLRSIISKIDQHIESLIHVNRTVLSKHASYTQLIRYDHNATYALHTDCQPNNPDHPQPIKKQRLFTFLMFLNNVKKGGDICFPNLNQCISPNRGTAILFHHKGHDDKNNIETDCDDKSAHYTKPTNQYRWVLQRFYYTNPITEIIVDTIDDGVTTGDFGLHKNLHKNPKSKINAALTTVRCDGSGSCRSYIIPSIRRKSNAAIRTAVSILKQSDATKDHKLRHQYLIQSLRLMSTTIQTDIYNVAAWKLLATTQLSLLHTSNAAAIQIPQLKEQCMYTLQQTLLYAHDNQLLKQLFQLKHGVQNMEEEEEEEDDEQCDTTNGKRKYGICKIHKHLPKLYLLGFQKCGTSSLHSFLTTASNEIVTADAQVHDETQNAKEIHYYNSKDAFQKGMVYYASHFTQRLPTQNSMYVDGTPDYIWKHGKAMGEAIRKSYNYNDEKMKKKVKFVLIVRPPENRLVSWWNHFNDMGWIDDLIEQFGNLDTFVRKTLVLYKGCVPPVKEMEEDVCDFQSWRNNWGRLSGIGGGIYGYWLDNFLKESKMDASQMHVTFLDSIHSKDTLMIDSMFTFLGVKRNQKDVTFPNLNSHSKHGYDDYRTYYDDGGSGYISKETMSLLKEHYQIWNCWLKELIVARNISYGGVFPEWLTC